VRVVVGSEATGVRLVPDALASVATSVQRFDLKVCQSRKDFLAALRGGPKHRVILSDLHGVHGEQVTASVKAGLERAGPGTCSVVLVVRPRQLLSVPAGGVELVALARYTSPTLKAWAVDFEKGFTDDQSRAELLRVTGGWPRLVDEVGGLCRRKGSRVALAEVSASLQRTGFAAEFVKAVEIDEGPLEDVYGAILEFAPTGNDRTSIAEVVAEAKEMPLAQVLMCIGALQLAGVFDDRGATLSPEAVFADAWRRRRSEGTSV
jgi:hypothetical protein